MTQTLSGATLLLFALALMLYQSAYALSLLQDEAWLRAHAAPFPPLG